MSLWRDEVLQYLDDAEMTEDDAVGLVYSLGSRFDWITNVTQLSDVIVLDEDGNEGEELTQPIRDAITNSYAWREGINDRINEHLDNLIPTVEVNGDGSFAIDGVGYTAQGEKK